MSEIQKEHFNKIADSSAVTAHLGFLQNAILRMAGNSASCKTWCLTLVAALLGVAGGLHVREMATTALMPIAIFGFLDCMYLGQEKAFRRLYIRVVGKIRNGSYGANDLYDMAASPMLSDFRAAITSWSTFPIYLGLIAVYAVAEKTGWLDSLAGGGAG